MNVLEIKKLKSCNDVNTDFLLGDVEEHVLKKGTIKNIESNT